MSKVTTTRPFRPADLGFPAVVAMLADGGPWQVEADVGQADLEAAVESAVAAFTPVDRSLPHPLDVLVAGLAEVKSIADIRSAAAAAQHGRPKVPAGPPAA